MRLRDKKFDVTSNVYHLCIVPFFPRILALLPQGQTPAHGESHAKIPTAAGYGVGALHRSRRFKAINNSNTAEGTVRIISLVTAAVAVAFSPARMRSPWPGIASPAVHIRTPLRRCLKEGKTRD